MPDYKEFYLTMMRASEQAIRILVEAQQECEERFLTDEEPTLLVIPKPEAEEEKSGTPGTAFPTTRSGAR